jgi:acyl-ACP thioesterase
VRFDALARYLQDVAEDDAVEAGWPRTVGWVVRKTHMHVRRFPVLGERLRLETFCSGRAAAWAERTTTITGDGGGSLQATSVWVAIDVVSGRPARLGDLFDRVYGPSAGDRRASARLRLPAPGAEMVERGRRWPLRFSDLDALGHVNNAISWAAVEDTLAATGCPGCLPGDQGRWPPMSVTLEHHRATRADDQPTLCHQRSEGAVDLWLVEAAGVLTAATAQSAPA